MEEAKLVIIQETDMYKYSEPRHSTLTLAGILSSPLNISNKIVCLCCSKPVYLNINYYSETWEISVPPLKVYSTEKLKLHKVYKENVKGFHMNQAV